MATPDRTTVKAAIQALMAELRANLRSDPPTATKPFRRIEEGQAAFGEYPRPFMTVRIVEIKPVGTTEGDKLLRVTIEMRLVTDVIFDDPHDAVLDAVGAVEDYFDELAADEQTIVEGADGFEERTWKLGYPTGAAGSQAAEATCRQSCIVKVEREYNRVPN
ncbi:MAG TPA: hypothetical protein VM243_14100 [Phycisphaerae bacterium]|nr:hypothetical protein [Phycisphaerae bacterium]